MKKENDEIAEILFSTLNSPESEKNKQRLKHF